jgi:hypothetical protein
MVQVWPCANLQKRPRPCKLITSSTEALPSGHPAHPGTRVGPVNVRAENLSRPAFQAWAL